MTKNQELLLTGLQTYGEREIPGAGRSSFVGRLIDRWFKRGADDSTTAWCGIWMSEIVSACGLTPPESPFRAKSWATWGRQAQKASPGSVVVLRRGPGLFHVTLAVRITGDGRVLCLGGNQNDAVTIASYSSLDVFTIRDPS